MQIDATAGANALDAGSVQASTWYYLFVIYDIDTTTAASLASTSATEDQPQRAVRPRTGGGGIAAHEYVMPELRRIAAMMAITAILLVVLTIVLR